ncbi:UNVERIFIED_CONTAM: hypothetical protein NCL1_08188 [Trichonephila clavipes]
MERRGKQPSDATLCYREKILGLYDLSPESVPRELLQDLDIYIPTSCDSSIFDINTFSYHYGNEEAETTEGTKCFLWFGGRHVDNFVHRGKADISKLGVSSSFQDNFHCSLHTGYLEKIKKKGTFFFEPGGIKSLSLPRDLVELRGRIRNEFGAVTRDMLVRVWAEIEYRQDICRVTKGARLESL